MENNKNTSVNTFMLHGICQMNKCKYVEKCRLSVINGVDKKLHYEMEHPFVYIADSTDDLMCDTYKSGRFKKSTD